MADLSAELWAMNLFKSKEQSAAEFDASADKSAG
jgi:hypothetical protein